MTTKENSSKQQQPLLKTPCGNDTSREVDLAKTQDQLVTELARARLRIAELVQVIEGRTPAPSVGIRHEILFRSLFVSNIIGIIAASTDGSITRANDLFLQMVGYRRADLPLRWDLMTPPEWREMDQLKLRELATTGAGKPWEKEYLRKDGSRVPILLGVALLDGSENQVIAFVLDLTASKQAEKKILEYQERLRDLAATLTSSEEQQRRKIGSKFHDGVGQTLAMIKLKVGELDSGAGRSNSEVHTESLREIHRLLDSAIDSSRALNLELTSPTLYELGLAAALQDLGETLERESGARFHFQAGETWRDPGNQLGIILFQIAREVLSNIRQHAEARNVHLSIEGAASQVEMRIEDDGVGFDATASGPAFESLPGHGIFSIQERLLHLGGSLRIDSAPGKGTHLEVTVPRH